MHICKEVQFRLWKLFLNVNLEKHELSVPEFYWKAFCYEGNGEVYSWAYIQENDDTQKLIDEKNFMLVRTSFNL